MALIGPEVKTDEELSGARVKAQKSTSREDVQALARILKTNLRTAGVWGRSDEFSAMESNALTQAYNHLVQATEIYESIGRRRRI